MENLQKISKLLSVNIDLEKEQIELIFELLKNGVSPEIISKILEEIQKESFRKKYQ